MAPPKSQKGGAKVSYGPPQWQAKLWNAVDATTAESKLQKVWITLKCINVVLFSVKALRLSHLLPDRCPIFCNSANEQKDKVLNDLSEAYNLYRTLSPESELSQMKAEYLVWTAMWKNASVDVPTTAIGALNSCSSAAFPIIHSLLAVLATLPVSTAEAERTFSKVTRTLTALRSTMTKERLEALILVQMFKFIAKTCRVKQI